MATNANGVQQPAGSDAFDPVYWMGQIVGSLHGRISILAANATARTGLATTCGWTPTASDPLVVLQTDTGARWRYDGSTWFPMVDVFAGTETVLVGTAPSAGVVIRHQSTTVTATTAADGTLSITLPTAAPNAVVTAQTQSDIPGSNLSIQVDQAGSTLSAVKVKVFFAADSSLYASASATISLDVTYW